MWPWQKPVFCKCSLVYGHTIREEQGFQASHLNNWKCGLGLGLPLDGIEAIPTETRGLGKSRAKGQGLRSNDAHKKGHENW